MFFIGTQCIELNMKWIGSRVAEIWPFAYVGGIWNPHFGGGGRRGRRGSAMAPLERAMVVSYRLSIATVALSVTVRPEFAIDRLRRSNKQGVGHFGPKFRGVPLGADPPCWGCKELTNGKLFSKNSNLCDHNSPTSQTDRQTDDMRSQYRFALKCIAR